MTDCCLCVCLRPRTYQRLIKDVFQSNYDHRQEETLEYYSKSKYERLLQYMINYPSKLPLIINKLESKFVKYYCRKEFSQLLLILEIMKGIIKEYSNTSMQHLLETHLLFFISESLQTNQIAILKAITLLLKECIKYQVFYNYNTFLGMKTRMTTSATNPSRNTNETALITSLPYTKEDHYDFIFIILQLCNHVIMQQKQQKFQELEDKEIELKHLLKGKRKSSLNKEKEEEEEEEKIDDGTLEDDSTLSSSDLLIDDTDAISCLGLTMIITMFGLFRSQGPMKSTPSASTPSSYLNHIHNANNKYFHIILQVILKLLIFITPKSDKLSIYVAYPNLANEEIIAKIFQETRQLLQQHQQQGSSATSSTTAGGGGGVNIASIPFLLWKIIKLFFSYQTIHESVTLYEQMIHVICSTFHSFQIPFNSKLFLTLHYFIYKTYQYSYYQHHHHALHPSRSQPGQRESSSGNVPSFPPVLFFQMETVVCIFIINTIYSSTQNNSQQYRMKLFQEQKEKLEKQLKSSSVQKSDGTVAVGGGGGEKIGNLVRIQQLRLHYEIFYSQFETIPSTITIQTELIEFPQFLFDGSELFFRNISSNFFFLQNSLSFLFLYLNYFLKSPSHHHHHHHHHQTHYQNSSSTTAADFSSSTPRNHIDSLINLNYYFQLIVSYLIKTNDQYFFSKSLMMKNNEFFSSPPPVAAATDSTTTTGGNGSVNGQQDYNNIFLSSIRKSFHHRHDVKKGSSSRGYLSSYNKYLSRSNVSGSVETIPEEEESEDPFILIDEHQEDLLASTSQTISSIKDQTKPLKNAKQKKIQSGKYDLILDDAEEEGDPTERIPQTKTSARAADGKEDIKTNKIRVAHEELLDNIIFLIYETLNSFTQHSLYQFQFNANIGKVLEIALQKTYMIEKALFTHTAIAPPPPASPATNNAVPSNKGSSLPRRGSRARVLSIGGSSRTKDYQKYYQLQFFYYYSFSLLELIISKVSINYSSMIFFSLEESAGMNAGEAGPQSDDAAVMESALFFTPTFLQSLEHLLKSFQEMECFQQILLFVMKLMTIFSKLMMNNHLPDQIVQSIIMQNSQSFLQQRSYYQNQISLLIQEMTDSVTVAEKVEEHRGLSFGSARFSASSSSFFRNLRYSENNTTNNNNNNHHSIRQRTHQFLFKRLLFYPYTIQEFHSFLSIIFNHLMNLSADYYIPKLIFYWNFHIYLTLLIGENAIIATIPMFHKILSLLPILENNLIQKSFFYYYIIQYFLFISQLCQAKEGIQYLQQECLSQLSYQNIIQENIRMEPLPLPSSTTSSLTTTTTTTPSSTTSERKKPQPLSLMVILKYTRTFYYNSNRSPPSPASVTAKRRVDDATIEEGSDRKAPKRGIYSLQSTYVINQSIYVKDVDLNLSAIVTRLLKNHILKKYSYEFTQALSCDFVPFDPTTNIFLKLQHLSQMIPPLTEEKEDEEEEKQAEGDGIGVAGAVQRRQLFAASKGEEDEKENDRNREDTFRSREDLSGYESDARSMSSRDSKSTSRQKKSKKVKTNKRDSTLLIRQKKRKANEAIESADETSDAAEKIIGIKGDAITTSKREATTDDSTAIRQLSLRKENLQIFNENEIATTITTTNNEKRVMKKRRSSRSESPSRKIRYGKAGSETEDSELDEDNRTTATSDYQSVTSEKSKKSIKSTKSIKSSKSLHSQKSLKSSRSKKSTVTTISRKKEMQDIYDIVYNTTEQQQQQQEEVRSITATSMLTASRKQGIESIQEGFEEDRRVSLVNNILDKNHRTVYWRQVYQEKSKEFNDQIVRSRDYEQFCNVLEML